MLATSLAKSLRNLRIKRRMTQENLAVAAGVSRRTISALENEATFVTVNLFSLNKVLEALGHALTITPSRAPTLADLIQDSGRLHPGGEVRYRVRKTIAEQPAGEEPCNSMSM
ncbi:MAG: helix-turn-helix domain-containing protein [Sideroxyarcus sp.]|nr:helix-turn-helix domain-containing protein [Sideroxyarcus sp.]